MKLEAARAIIESSPRTHLGLAARAVLALLDQCDTARLEEVEAHQSVLAEEIAKLTRELAPLPRLRDLEAVCEAIRDAKQPETAMGLAVFRKVVGALTPHLTAPTQEPKVRP